MDDLNDDSVKDEEEEGVEFLKTKIKVDYNFGRRIAPNRTPANTDMK